MIAAAAVAYLVRKLHRVGVRADSDVDRALEQSLDSLHALIGRVLPDDPSLTRLYEQARVTDSEVPERTKRRAIDAIADAAQENENFANQLRDLVEELQRQEQTAHSVTSEVKASHGGVAAGGNMDIHAENGGVFAPGADSVTVENKFTEYVKRNPAAAIIAVIVAVVLFSIVVYSIINAGSGLSGSSTCSEYLSASSDDQHAVVNDLASKYGKPDYVSPLGFPEVAYWCASQQNATLDQFFRNAND